MKPWWPAPLLSAGLFALWLLLARTLHPANLLLALLLAWLMTLLMLPLRPQAGPVRRPLVLAALILRVGGDVLQSALQVTWGIVRGRRRPPDSHFVEIPLVLRNEHALASLAMIASVIPGTVWSELAPDRSAVLIHVFDVGDKAQFIANFKARYEQPLQEIFE